jgi:hypothetical protein
MVSPNTRARLTPKVENMQNNEANDQEGTEPSRRRFLKAAAGAGVVGAVWSEPLIRGIPAYAADASSVTGALASQFISWSPARDNWDDDTSANIDQSPSLGMGDCGTSATYTVMGGTLSSTLTLTAVGSPDSGGSPSCMNATDDAPGVISLEPQTGCMFSAVSVTAGGFTLQNSGSQIVWSNIPSGTMGIQEVMFSITCG